MPAVSSEQFKGFYKSNPNQMALPGLEEHSHPGAMALSQGYQFKGEGYPRVGGVKLSATHPDWGDQDVSELHWRGVNGMRNRGEISWVHTNPGHEGHGLATALYGIGRTMARVKPRHSTDRTDDGDQWAPKASAKYGGPVPKNKRDPTWG